MKSSEKGHKGETISSIKDVPKSCSKLVKRLYKNSSLKRLNPNSSLLSTSPIRQSEGSFLNRSSNQLVASISLKKFKKSNISQRSLQISNGKIMITQQNDLSKFRESMQMPKKKMFKKLDKLDPLPQTNKILPDELVVDFPIENELKPLKKPSNNKSSKGKKATKNSAIVKTQHENLRPEDFMQLIREDKCITNQFCYLKKMEHPYDLKIILFQNNFESNPSDLHQRNMSSPVYPDQYITISSRGITYFGKEQSRLVPFDQWKKEAQHFKKIMKLNFFKNYKIIKNFGNWKKYIRKSSMKSIMQKLKDQLVVNDRFLRNALLETRTMCFRMETDVSYCKLDECQNVMEFQNFKTTQELFIQNQFERKIAEIQEEIKNVLITNMSSSMKEFKDENKISSGIEGKGMPLLIGDEKNLDMPYTKEATLRTQQQKFKKFVKLIDLLITHSKVNMMQESTDILAKKINEENQSYQRQVIETKYKHSYKGKQYLECKMTLDTKNQTFYLNPTQEEVSTLFEGFINRSVVRLCRNHKKISGDTDILSIIYDNSDQFPKDQDSGILKLIMTSDERQKDMVGRLMKELGNSYSYIEKYSQKFVNLVEIYFSNIVKLANIDKLTARDHETIKIYMQNWRNQLEKINQINQDHESSIFLLNLKDFKNKATGMTTDCIGKIKKIIPIIFQHAIVELTQTLTNALSQMENKPIGIQSYMVFQNHKNAINNDLEDYSDRMLEINCLWILIKNITPVNLQSTNMKKQEREIRELQTILNNLRKKIQQADMNNKIYETRAQEEVKQMVPKNKSRVVQLYNKITALAREERETSFMISFIEKKSEELKSITTEMQDIRVYQRFLNLEECQREDIENFTKFYQIFQQIWETKVAFEVYWQKKILETSWGSLDINEISQKFEEFITIMLQLEKTIKIFKKDDFPYQLSPYDIRAINTVVDIIQKQKPLVETLECLNDKFLTDKQWRQIKYTLETMNQNELVKFLEKDRHETTTQELIDSSIIEHLNYLKNIVYKAKKQNDVINKLESIKTFWKTQTGVCRNLLENFSDNYQNLMMELEQNLVRVNCIHDDPNEKQRIKKEKQTLERLRDVLLLWDQHEQHTAYFDGIYNALDWKVTKQGKTYCSADQNWKKNIKQFKDTQLNKLVINDKIYNLLQENNQIYKQLYESAHSYVNSKRIGCPRLFFLSDNEMIRLYSEHKDFKSLNRSIERGVGNERIFRHVKQFVIKQDEQIPHEVKNLDGEIISLKLGRINNFEVEELIRILQQSIKLGVKTSLKTCYQAFDTETFNRGAWINEYPLQVLLFVEKVYFTRIIECDYLCQDGDDLNRLLTFHLSQIESLKAIGNESLSPLAQKKVNILLTQSLHTRDIITYLRNNKVEQMYSFDWLKQIRQYYYQEQAYTEYLALPVNYSNEFVSLFDNPLISNGLNEKFIIQFLNTTIACLNLPLSEHSAIEGFCAYNGKNYAQLKLSLGKETRCLENFLMGTWLTGTFTDIVMPENIAQERIKVISKFMKEVKVAISHREPFLRGNKSLFIHREAGVLFLFNSPSWANLPSFKSDYRVIRTPEISISAYLQILLEVDNICVQKSFIYKLSKMVQFAQKTMGKKLITFSELKKIVENSKEDIGDFEDFLKEECVKIMERKLMDRKKGQFLNRLFFEEQKRNSFERKPSNKLVMPDKIQIDSVLMKVNHWFKKERVCVFAGKQNLIKELIIKEIYQEHSPNSEKFSNTFEYMVEEGKLAALLGSYDQKQWMDGFLIHSLQFINTRGSPQCLILKGVLTKDLVEVLSNFRDNSLYLENGEKVQINGNVKLIFNAVNDYYSCEEMASNLLLFDCESWNLKYEDSFAYVMEKYSNPYLLINYSDHYTSLSNIFLNNYEKISSNLKLIGFKNQFLENELIMRRFVKIVDSALAKDSQKCCLKKIKMLEKLYFWAIYWAISSGVPKPNIMRLQKILFDTIKTETDRSQSPSQTYFVISERMQTISKALKDEMLLRREKSILKVSCSLEAKAEFVQLMSWSKHPVVIIGEKGSGKSTFLAYLQHKFTQNKSHPYNFLTVSLHKKMTFDELIASLMSSAFIRIKPTQEQCPNRNKFYLSPLNSSKLILALDNLNLINSRAQPQLFYCIKTLLQEQYFFHPSHPNNKIYLDNISIICAENGSYESMKDDFVVENCMPVWVDQLDLKEVMDEYKGMVEVQDDELQQKVFQVLDSTVSIHNFVTTLMQPSLSCNKYHLSIETPLWIAQEMISQAARYTNVLEFVSSWRYLCLQKYAYAGYGSIQTQEKDQIWRELNNLINLMIKNSDQVGNMFQEEKILLKQIVHQFPILNSAPHTDYYLYLLYLMKTDNANVFRLDERLPSWIKAQVLHRLCEQVGVDFVKVSSILQLTTYSKQKKVLFVGSDTALDLLEVCLVEACNQRPNMSFFIDSSHGEEILARFPFLTSSFHIYSQLEQQQLSFAKTLPTSYQSLFQWLSIEMKTYCIPENQDYLLMDFYHHLKNLQPTMKKHIDSRHKSLAQANNNFQYISQLISVSKKELSESEEQVQQLTKSEDRLMSEKNSFVKELSQLKALESDDTAKKEQINKSISSIESELEKVKRKKNQLMEEMKKKKQIIQENESMGKLLVEMKKQFNINYGICKQIQQNTIQTVLCTVLLLMYYESRNKKKHKRDWLLQISQKLSKEKLNIRLSYLYSILFNCKIKNIQNQAIILWSLFDRSVTFITKPSQISLLVEQFQSHFPEITILRALEDLEQKKVKGPIIVEQYLDQRPSLTSGIIQTKDPCCLCQISKDSVLFQFQIKSDDEFVQNVHQKIGHQFATQIQFINKQKKQFQHESKFLESQLKTQLQNSTNPFIAKNTHAELKQIFEAIANINERVATCEKKVKELESEREKQIGSLISHIFTLKKYIDMVTEVYPYINVTQKTILHIITQSITFQAPKKKEEEQKEEGKEEREEQVEEQVEKLDVEKSKQKILEKIHSWISLMLKPDDAIYGYFLLACYTQRGKGEISEVKMVILENLLLRGCHKRLAEFIGKEQWEYLSQFSKSQKLVFKTIKDDFLKIACSLAFKNRNKFIDIIAYSQKQLFLNFKHEMIMNRNDAIERALDLTGRKNQKQKTIVVIGGQSYDSLKIIDRQLHKIKGEEECIFILNEEDTVPMIIDNLEKVSPTITVWCVLPNWNSSQNITSMISYAEIRTSTIPTHIVLLFERSEKYVQVKPKLKLTDLTQVSLYDKERNTLYLTQKLLAKYSPRNASTEQQKLMKIIFFEKMSRMAKNLISNNEQTLSSYDYRFFDTVIKRYPKISANSLAEFVIQFYCSTSKGQECSVELFIKEAKKVIKHNNLPDVYDDGHSLECFSMIHENSQQIREKIENEDMFQQFLKKIIPKSKNQTVPIDALFQFQNPSPQFFSEDEQLREQQKGLNFKEGLAKVQQLLNKIPPLPKPEKPLAQTKIGTSQLFSKTILKSERQKLERIYEEKVRNIKLLKKKLLSDRTIAPGTLQNLDQVRRTYSHSLSEIEKKVQLLDSIIQSKELNRSIYLDILSHPKTYICVFLYELNHCRVDWINSEVCGRCFNDKEREIFFENLERRQYLCLPSAYVENAKFDSHKAYLENKGQEDSKYDKMNSNIFIFFKKEEAMTGNSRKVPVFHHRKPIIDILVPSKMKDNGIWDEKVAIIQRRDESS